MNSKVHSIFVFRSSFFSGTVTAGRFEMVRTSKAKIKELQVKMKGRQEEEKEGNRK